MASGTTVLPIRDGITPAAVIGVPLQQLVSTISAAWLIILIWKPKRRVVLCRSARETLISGATRPRTV